MEKHYTLKNILLNLISDIKKQDFLVYFRKISLIDSNETKMTFGVLSSFMKDNLEAKFYDIILKAAKKEIPTLERIEFIIDKNIENLSNTNSIDCAKFFKESNKKTKTVSKNPVV
jgi:chromosomal replication initiation ATPase DnaA